MIEANLPPDDRAVGLRNPPERIEETLGNDIVPIFVIDDYDRWIALLYSEENLASTPPIPLEAMRREVIYEGHD